ncbi:MAG TPA: hypothetical protein DIT46_04380 [Gemmatimonadetes bacterium]|nr:hypothetical protein [Gemmatimonadota bacterium]
MILSDIWDQLKRRRVTRVVIAYAASFFVVLQMADLVFEPLGFPETAFRVLLFLGIAGFPLAVAVAWAFDATPEGVKETSTERESGPRRSAVLVVGVSLIVAIGVGYWQFSDRHSSSGDGPVDVDENLIAVIPFRVSSTDDRVTILQEGVIDMLAPMLPGEPRIVDPGAMVSAWRRLISDDQKVLSESQAVSLASDLGAGRALVGSIVGGGEGFAMNARLLHVPTGEAVGDATVDGSADRLRESVSQLAGQVLSMEAGIDQGQVDYLDDVPMDALQAYLEGRRAYRQTAYVEARGAFSRALDIDSTFALAALGAVDAVQMGLDADRFNFGARARRLLVQNLDRLPHRDRDFVKILLDYSSTRLSAVERVNKGQELVRRFPDKAEAWYLYGDAFFHAQYRVAESDWGRQALEAFDRAIEIDPGLMVVDQHRAFDIYLSDDTVGLRALVASEARSDVMSESVILARAAMAYMLGDPESLEWFEASLETLPFPAAQLVASVAAWPTATVPTRLVDRIFDHMERSAFSEADHRQALMQRYAYLRNGGRAAEADEQLRLIEAEYGPRPDSWVSAYLYWDGLRESAVAAVPELEAQINGDKGPITYADGGQIACMLELWRLREGDHSTVASTIERLRAGADDPDPAHGQNALCALTLETIAADRKGSPSADRLVDQLVQVLDKGPAQRPNWVSLEAAWMLEDRGDFVAAARVAGYVSGTDPYPFAASTVHREAARLSLAASDTAKAVHRFKWYITARPDPDPEFLVLDREMEAMMGVPRR